MTTHSLAARRPAAGFGRVLALLAVVAQSFAEAQALARAAHRRYPFAEW